MHDHAPREWAVRTAARGVGVTSTPSPRVISLVSKARAPRYGLPLFASAVGKLPRVHPLV